MSDMDPDHPAAEPRREADERALEERPVTLAELDRAAELLGANHTTSTQTYETVVQIAAAIRVLREED